MKPLDVVDLFCGAGGTSAGILKACADLKRKVRLIAVNHWTTAINTHSLNHPNVHHICEPVENLWPARVVKSRRLHLLAASCECTFHSNARGGGPCNEQSRSQPWQLIRWCSDIQVDNVLMENVREFKDWGPLLTRGLRWKGKYHKKQRPDPRRKGEYFKAFLQALDNLGYSVEWRIQVCADYGDPTSRPRLILLAKHKRRAITWPEQTHGPGRALPWRTARECIDWALAGESIFNRKKPLCANTLRRIAAGLSKFGGPNAEPFLVMLRGTADSNISSAKSVDEPLPTITTTGKHAMLCEPFVIGQQSGATPRSVGEPLPTVATAGAIRLVEPFLVMHVTHQGGDERRCHSVDKPLPTVTGAKRGEMALVEPFITPNFSEREGQKPRCHSVKEPLPTVTGHGAGMLVQPVIVQTDHTGGNGLYARPVDQPLATIVSKQNMLLVEPLIMKFYKTGRCKSVNQPLDTVTTKDRFMLVDFKTGETVAELDIRTRMLQPHELAQAHSFPRDYQFTGTKEDQTKQIGNSVPVELARAHARAALT